jgi:Spy/CpxP family protein refolding chaperone
MSAIRNIARKVKSIFIVALIFFSGVIVGGIIAGAAVVRDVTAKAYAHGPGSMRSLLVQHAKEGLSLDEDQKHLFWNILTETGAELNTATTSVQPELARILDHSERRLREVLRPEQTERFDRWMESRRKKRRSKSLRR